MTTDDRLQVEFTENLPKHPQPEPTDDWATVDLDVAPDQAVIHGHFRNPGSDSRDERILRELTFEEPTNGDPGTLAAVLQIVRRDREIVIGGPEFYTYRVAVLFEIPLPARFEIAHRDTEEDSQCEVVDAFVPDRNAYQEPRLGR